MIDETCQVTTLGSVNNAVHVYTEQVGGSYANLLILNFSEICNDGSDALPNVLNYHLIRSNGLHGKQSPVVNTGLAKPKEFLTELEKDMEYVRFYMKLLVN